MRVNARWIALAASLATGTFGRPAAAQAWNMPLGGRTATMGGAGVAEGHDIAAPLVNPAGLGAIDLQVFGLSSSAYSYSTERAPGSFTPRGFDAGWGRSAIRTNDYDSSSIGTLPSAIGYFRHFGNTRTDESGHLVLGLAALSPIQREQPATASFDADLLSTNGSIRWRRSIQERVLDLYVGPAAGLVLSRRVRVGAALLGLYRNRRAIEESSFQLSSQGGNVFGVVRGSGSIETTSFGVVGAFGVQVQPIDHVWIGTSLHSPSLSLNGSAREGRSETTTSTTPDESRAFFDEVSRDLSHRSSAPPRFSLGAAWVKPHELAIAGDITLVTAFPGADVSSGQSREQTTESGSATRQLSGPFERRLSTNTVVDFSLGAELYLSKTVALRAGYGQTADPRPLPTASEESLGETRRSYRTVTAGVGLVFGPFDTTFGLAWQSMRGETIVRDVFGSSPDTLAAASYAGQELSGNTFMVLVSGTVSEERARRDLLARVAAVAPDAAAAAGAVFAIAERCPSTLDAEAMTRFDYAAALMISPSDAAAVRRGLVALARLRDATQELERDVTAACASIALDLGSAIPAEGSSRAVCRVAADAVAREKQRIGASVKWGLALTTSSCDPAAAAATCVSACSTSDVECQLGCELTAITTQCAPVVADLTIASAADPAGAERLRDALAKGLDRFVAAGRRLARSAALSTAAQRVVHSVTAIADAVGGSAAQKAVVGACVLAPVARSADTFTKLDGVVGAFASFRDSVGAER